MKIVIIEDEIPAVEKLTLFLERYDPDIDIIAILPDVRSSIEWFDDNADTYDLIFSDIKLTDGTSFDIFNKITPTAPVILITAFDEYALDAFKINSIDYLLKPITFDGLEASMSKMKKLREQLGNEPPQLPINQLNQILNRMQRSYKERFMVKIGDHIRSIKTSDITLFFAEDRTMYLMSADKRKYIVDYKLEALEGMLDPALFFRINRSVLININAIQDVVVYSNSRLKVVPGFPFEKELIVSREKVAPFKTWLEGRIS